MHERARETHRVKIRIVSNLVALLLTHTAKEAIVQGIYLFLRHPHPTCLPGIVYTMQHVIRCGEGEIVAFHEAGRLAGSLFSINSKAPDKSKT